MADSIDILELDSHLVGLVFRLETMDLGPALEMCKPIIAQGIAANFEARGTPGGTPWPPRVDNLPHPLLEKSGDMRLAATGGPGSVSETNDRELIVGVSIDAIPYAGFQNRGTQRIPAREYMGVNSGVLAECDRIIADYIEGTI